jgi:hypothetical protein
VIDESKQTFRGVNYEVRESQSQDPGCEGSDLLDDRQKLQRYACVIDSTTAGDMLVRMHGPSIREVPQARVLICEGSNIAGIRQRLFVEVVPEPGWRWSRC